MTPDQLKKSILNYATCGKLTNQLDTDTDVNVLLEQIAKQKQELIDKKEIKASKNNYHIYKQDNKWYEEVSGKITDITDQIPYEIPKCWTWVRLSTISKTLPFVKTKNSGLKNQGKYPCVSQGNKLIDGYLDNDECLQKQHPVIIFGDHTRNIKYIDFDYIVVGDGLKIVRSFVNSKFLFYALTLFANKIKDRGYSRHWSLLNKLLFPLPPLEEQQRIVSKLEKLLPLVDKYSQLYNELKGLDDLISTHLKKSILNYATSGKLTNQLDTDTDVNVLLEQIAKQKQELIDKKEIKASKNNYHIYKQDNKWYEEVSGKITDITDQIPYEIPKCWTWVRLETVANSITDGVHQKPNYIKEGVKFISVKNINDGILDDKFSKYISENEFNSLFTEQKIPKKGDILYGKCGTIGVSTIVHNNEKYGLFVSLALIKLNKELISNKYINLVLSSPFLRLQGKLYTVGVGNKTIPLKSISKLLLPLPPLEEQQRIVDKLNELIPLIEKLK